MKTATQLSKQLTDRPPHLKASKSQRRPLIELAARHSIEPYDQGELDYLCGVYSIVNAIRLAREANAPMAPRHTKLLFEQAIDFLFQKNALHPAVIDGITIRRWRKLAVLLAKKASTKDVVIVVEFPPKGLKRSPSALVDWLKDGLAIGAPILLHLGSDRQHYTVVAGADDKNLYLFDSTGAVRIKRYGCVKRYSLTSKTMMRLSVKLHI